MHSILSFQSLTFLSFPLSISHSYLPFFPSPTALLLALPSGVGAHEMDSALVCNQGSLKWEPGTATADSRIIYAALL